MKNLLSSIRFVFTFGFLLICGFAAQAQTRTFVSGLGSDANLCTRSAPCRSFQRAHDLVDSGGEVIAIDSAGYGPVAITKSVTIIGDGVYAGINTNALNAILIATPGITVNLRSLIIAGLGTADRGIYATDFTVLHIENCIISGFVMEGILVAPSGGGPRRVNIEDSIVRNNQSIGIVLDGIASTLKATVERTRMEKNNSGLDSRGTGATVIIRGCLASGNTGSGFAAELGGVLNIEKGVSSNNGTGISASVGATVTVSDSMVTNNTGVGFSSSTIPPSTFLSRGNNTVAGNNGGGAQTSGTISPLAAL